MLVWYDYLLLFLFGSIGGYLSGLLGIGGGIVYVATLRFYISRYDIPDEEAVKFVLSNSIIGTFFAGIAGSVRQASYKYFFPREILIIGLSAIVASLSVTSSIIKWDWYSAKTFNILFFFVMLLIAANFILLKQKYLEPRSIANKQVKTSTPVLVFIGLLTGLFSALSGLGGGVVLVYMLTRFVHLDIRKAASISLGSIPIQALATGVYYGISASPVASELPPLTYGYVIVPIIAPILLGVIVASPAGVKMAHKTSPKIIRIIFAVIVLLIAIQTLHEHFKDQL